MSRMVGIIGDYRLSLHLLLLGFIVREWQDAGVLVSPIPFRDFNQENPWPPIRNDVVLAGNIDLRHHQRWPRLKRTVRDPRGMLADIRNQSRNYKQQERLQQKRKSGRRNGSQRGN